ncbi:hypothetical protein ACFCV3_10320 [Kribbella sp. NPDC056345]|uniref:hypothetical protein n=1 Tax=Kribbella sp. NPDC056345 TaxID=3345789 RepID=UPI0035D533C8
MMSRKPSTIGASLRRKATARNRTAAETPARRLLSGKNWLLVTLVGAIISVAIPSVFPRTIDSVRDLWSDDPITIETADVSATISGVPIVATPGSMPKTGDILAIADLAYQAGGQPAGFSGQRLTFRNHRSSKVLVTGIKPVIENRAKPLDGTLVKYANQGGDSKTTVVDLDLDAPQPQPTGQTESGERTDEPFFAGRNIVLDPGETHLMHFRTVTKRCDCTWRLQVTYRYHDQDRTVTVPATDHPPFRMTAYAVRYRTVYHVDPTGIQEPDPKTYCADAAICRATVTSCGKVRTASGTAVVRVEKGTTPCKEALRITDRYYNDDSITRQGSGGFAEVDGWSCGSTTAAEAETTGHLGSCTRGPSKVSMDAT